MQRRGITAGQIPTHQENRQQNDSTDEHSSQVSLTLFPASSHSLAL